AALMDLADLGGNVNDGCHIASMGGTWMVFTFGFAGMKGNGGLLSFSPNLPSHINNLKFPLTYRGSLIEIEIDRKNITYKLLNGKETELLHNSKKIKLTPGKKEISKTLKSIKKH
nr:glycoside hydrolase family 65 protein [Candidatus Dadabacteria bacterium]NIV14996.1 glycoside hydrolase family 65 protein [Fodinibius sp.]NIV73089.1 glycoside hydrolase family 65 protein [Calditrichia bacterium]NIW00376.1 glycoside hydrolase family 65 protein [Candidatus Saccharibacteria bacterium]NIW80734.1 glycoside hydrolase family 65 protein [Calditrichia bacterium]